MQVLPNQPNGRYSLGEECRASPDYNMEDIMTPLRSGPPTGPLTTISAHTDVESRGWCMHGPQPPFSMTPGVETSCRNNLHSDQIYRHNTHHAVQGGTLVPVC